MQQLNNVNWNVSNKLQQLNVRDNLILSLSYICNS